MSEAIPPKPPTLKKHGLSLDDWLALLERQGGVCFVCEKLPKSGRLHIDHFHANGYKKMPPEQRKQWIRGLLCWWCNNRYVGRGITIEKARRVVEYVDANRWAMRDVLAAPD